ncbi:MAG: sigma-70 family RNA polymerase sigma factor [Beijerinckiaceae bacterium]
MSSADNAELANLIGAVGRRDRHAFNRLYELAAPKLFGLVLRILRDRAMAEDVLQDVFMRIWQSAEGYAPAAGPAMAWLTAIARNRAIDMLRVKGPPRSANDENEADYYEKIASPGDPETDMADLAALRHCLGEIDEPARTCVLLAYYEGYSREELARRFDRPVNTIKTWLHRSLAALRTCLETLS